MDEATVEGGGGRVQPEEDRRCPAGRTGAKHEADPEVSWNRDPASEPLDPQTLLHVENPAPVRCRSR